MSYALVADVFKSGLPNGAGTTSSVDTTGADLIVICVWVYGGTTALAALTVSDNMGNTYVSRVSNGSNTYGNGARIYDCDSPTVGTGHTFTVSGTSTYASISASAWSGSAASAFDQSNNNDNTATAGGTTVQTGSITPTETNELLITVVGVYTDVASQSANNSFATITGHEVTNGAGNAAAGEVARLIQTSIISENVTWTFTSTKAASACIASWKAASGVGGGSGLVKTTNGVVAASVKTNKGVAVASVKTVKGVANV